MDIILRAGLMYLVVLIMLRVTTRRIMKSATPLDMAVIFLFGGMAVPSILGDDRSITGACLAIATVALLHYLLSAARMKWPLIGRITEGTSVIVYRDGDWDIHQMTFSRVTKQDVMSEVRQNGMVDIKDVETVIVEHNGGITVLPKTSQDA